VGASVFAVDVRRVFNERQVAQVTELPESLFAFELQRSLYIYIRHRWPAPEARRLEASVKHTKAAKSAAAEEAHNQELCGVVGMRANK